MLNKEISGFVANRILGVVRDEAISLYENGIASFEDIDTACRTALGYPMGPFELMDLTGIRSSAFMLMYGVVWVSLIWMYFTEVRRTPVMGPGAGQPVAA